MTRSTLSGPVTVPGQRAAAAPRCTVCPPECPCVCV